jgi:PD-(D/E)XK endonuclease
MGLFGPKPKEKGVKAALGAESEAIIATELLQSGYPVWIPVGNTHRYDLVIEDAGGEFWKVQCKTAWIDKRSGTLMFSTCSNHYNYRQGNYNYRRRVYSGQIDYFAVYSPDLNKVYLIPVAHVATETSMSLRFTETRNNQKKGIKYAADYKL